MFNYNCNCKYFNLIYIPVGVLVGDFFYSLYHTFSKKNITQNISKNDIENNQSNKNDDEDSDEDVIKGNNVTFNQELINYNLDDGIVNTGSIIGGMFGFAAYFSRHKFIQNLYKKYV